MFFFCNRMLAVCVVSHHISDNIMSFFIPTQHMAYSCWYWITVYCSTVLYWITVYCSTFILYNDNLSLPLPIQPHSLQWGYVTYYVPEWWDISTNWLCSTPLSEDCGGW